MATRLQSLVLAGVAVAVLVGLLLTGQWLGARYLGDAPVGAPQSVLLGTGQCSPLGEECVVRGKGGVALALRLPEAVPPLTRFAIEVRVAGIDAESVTVDFEMPDMDMGLNRARLARVARADTSDRWTGAASLPVCLTGRLDWVARVIVRTADAAYRADFPFIMTR